VKNIWMFAILAVLLTACAEQADEAPESAEVTEAPETPTALEVEDRTDEAPDLEALVRTDPEALREAMRDPEQREALMQAMRERRAQGAEGEGMQDREQMRERMRQRREELMAGREGDEIAERMRQRRAGARGNWWEDDEIRQSIELSEDQGQTLAEAHQTLDQVRINSRQSLATSQRELMQAVQAADRDTISRLLDQRQQASAALAEAEADWLRTVLDQLNDEQLQTLARQHPHLLTARMR
jgi:hypothetical protein